MSNSVKRCDFVAEEKWAMVQSMMAVGVCSVCGRTVNATKNGLAPRHGFERYREKRVIKITAINKSITRFSQEDNTACSGSGKEVVWKKVK
jgi:hypothetical protein